MNGDSLSFTEDEACWRWVILMVRQQYEVFYFTELCSERQERLESLHYVCITTTKEVCEKVLNISRLKQMEDLPSCRGGVPHMYRAPPNTSTPPPFPLEL